MPNSSATTIPKKTARLMMLFRRVREWAATALAPSSPRSSWGRWSSGAPILDILHTFAAQRALAEARRREAVAAAEGGREVRGLAVADEARDVADGDRALLDEQIGGRSHAAREQI